MKTDIDTGHCVPESKWKVTHDDYDDYHGDKSQCGKMWKTSPLRCACKSVMEMRI